jgi:hypothetical protein
MALTFGEIRLGGQRVDFFEGKNYGIGIGRPQISSTP